MEEKYVWPLVGVFLGWLLTFFATNLKDRGDRRRRVGLLLSKLIQSHDQLGMLILATETFKDHADNFEEYERHRKGISDRHFLEPKSQIESLNAAIDDVAGDYPFQALKLQSLVNTLLKCKAASLSDSSKSEALYVQLISLHEVTLELAENELRKQIKWIAFTHGLLTFIKVQHLFFTKGKWKSGNTPVFQKLWDEAFSEIKKAPR